MSEAFQKGTLELYMENTVAQLLQKRIRANLCVRVAREETEAGHPDGEKVLAHYRGERALILQALQIKKYGEEGPPAQSIAMKTASIAGDGRMRRPESAGERQVITMEDLFKTIEKRGD